MCGIAGILAPGHADRIRDMARCMRHRGPDEEGYFSDEALSLGQQRLAIVDLESGRQPICDETGRLQLVCNGEIYNSPSLRRDLEARGHRFRTATDVEVILHLYQEHGPDCVRHLRGMFALALWDPDRDRLLLARDPLGQKPLFYAETEGALVFASEVKGVLASGLVQRDIDLDGLWHYISLRYLPDAFTLFRGVQKLPAACRLVRESGRTRIERYWDLSFEPKHEGSERELTDRLDALLRETVELHLLSDVPVGTFLSGGIDSSLITAIMARVCGRPFPTFSIGVKEHGFNELPYARMVSSHYNLEAREKVVEADMIHLIPAMIHHLDEPSDPFAAGVYLVSRAAAEEVKVVLTGDGGDENFAGYDRFAGQRLADLYALLPTGFRRTVMKRLVDAVPESFGYKSLAQKAAWMHAMSFHARGERYAHSMSFLRFTPEGRDSLFTAGARARIGDADSVGKILRFYNADNAREAVDRMLYTDLMTRMPDHLLSIVDRMAMAHSLEARPPLMDVRMVEFAAALPGRMKLRGRTLKYLLRRLAARYLPRELIHRPKQGFGFPLGAWMRGELRGFLTRLFDESRFVDLGLFDRAEMQRILGEHLSGRADHNYRIWILMNLEIWYRMSFEGATVESMRAFIDERMRPSA